MSKYRNGLVFAMEEGETVDAVVAEPVEQVQAEAEVAAAEVQEHADQVEDITDAIDSTVTDAGTLEQVQDVMEEAVEEGEGVSEQTAEVAQIAVEAIYQRLGIKAKSVSLESFGSTNTRLQATKLSLESMKETMKKIWDAVVKAFKQAYEFIANLLTKIFDSTERIKKAAEALKKAAGEKKGFKVKEASIEVGGLAEKLGSDGKFGFDTANEILKNQKDLTDGLPAIVEGLRVAVVGTSTMVARSSGATGSKDEVLKKLKSSLPGDKTPVLFGGVVGEFKVDESAGTVGVEFVPGKAAEGKLEVTDGSLDQVSGMADNVISLMDSTDKFKKSKDTLKKVVDEVTKLAEQAIKVADAADSKDDKEAVAKAKEASAAARSLVIGLNKTATKVLTFVPSSNIRAGAAAVALGNAVLKDFVKEEAKAA